MYWTLELASKLEDAPWPATKDELIDFSIRSGAPQEVIENLREIEDEGEVYESIEIFGLIILQRRISFSTKMSIDPLLKKNYKPAALNFQGGFFYPGGCLKSLIY